MEKRPEEVDVEGVEPNSGAAAGAAVVVSAGLARLPKSGVGAADVDGAGADSAGFARLPKRGVVVVDVDGADNVAAAVDAGAEAVDEPRPLNLGAAVPKSGVVPDPVPKRGVVVFLDVSETVIEGIAGAAPGAGAAGAGAVAAGSAGLLPKPNEYDVVGLAAEPPERPNDTVELVVVGLKAFAPNTNVVPPLADLYFTCPQQGQLS